ncbi:unnamed protein product, partial [Iphiclides podalirius]
MVRALSTLKPLPRKPIATYLPTHGTCDTPTAQYAHRACGGTYVPQLPAAACATHVGVRDPLRMFQGVASPP